MSRIYSVPYSGTVTNAGGNADLLEALPADDKPIKLRGLVFSQISEVGDAAAEGLQVQVAIASATVTSGSGGSSVTPATRDSADSAAGFAAECNNSTVATTSGSLTTRDYLGWIIQNSPWDFWYPDSDFAPKAKQGEGLIVRLDTTPADDFTGCFTFWVEEE
jgi:hypothetical protein